MANVAARTQGFIHTRLLGPVSCRAYGIGPAAVRLGRVTIVISDRMAAHSVAAAALFFAEIAPKLGPTYQNRPGVALSTGRGNEKNDLTALVALNGTQQIRDRDLTPAYTAADGCGQASLTIGNAESPSVTETQPRKSRKPSPTSTAKPATTAAPRTAHTSTMNPDEEINKILDILDELLDGIEPEDYDDHAGQADDQARHGAQLTGSLRSPGCSSPTVSSPRTGSLRHQPRTPLR